MDKSLNASTLIPVKLFNNPLASCSLRNFKFLLLHTEHIDESILPLFLILTTFGFLLSAFFYISNNKVILF